MRVLTGADARVSYPLMALSQPALTLGRWRATLRHAHQSRTGPVLGVLTPAGYLLALARLKNGKVAFLAKPPALLGDIEVMAKLILALARKLPLQLV